MISQGFIMIISKFIELIKGIYTPPQTLADSIGYLYSNLQKVIMTI